MLAPSVRLSAVALAVGVTLSLTTPAFAATTPTISAPAFGLGFGDITITGTARAGATVSLIEAAYIFRSDMAPAQDYSNAGEFVTATANSTGHYSMTRTLDSGFVFAVEADGVRSNTIAVGLRLAPELTVSSASNGALTVDVAVGLAQPGMAVHIQRSSAGTAWTTLNTGYTDNSGNYSATVTGQTTGASVHIRAYLEQNAAAPTGYADAQDNVWSNWTDTVSLVIGAAGQTRTAATSAPAAPGHASTPSTPVSTPAGPKAGSVTFSKIQYDSPGRDTGSNASRNGEWFRLTNRTSRTIDLKSWTVRDAAGHTYTFGSYGLRAGKTVSVHTGRGTANATNRYWGGGSYIWNNGGDTATLRTNAGKTIDSCRYSGGGKGYTAC